MKGLRDLEESRGLFRAKGSTPKGSDLEEQRIGRMYVNLFLTWIRRVWDGMFPRGLRRSSALPAMVIGLVIVLPIVAWKLHRLGRFGAIKREIKGDAQDGAGAGPRPGGLDPIVLTLAGTPGDPMPEFRSVTMLPGLGMDVLQITAYLPSRGEVELLAAPTVRDMADGTTPTRSGPNDRWGAIEVPWSGQLKGLLTPVGTSVRTEWRGKTVEAPNDVAGRSVAEGGMLATMSADTTQAAAANGPASLPGQASATFKGLDFGDHWISKTDVTVGATLGQRTIELTVSAKNVGDQAEPMGLGWHPRFVVPSGNRDAVEIRLPGGQQIEITDRDKGVPSGRFMEPGAAIGRFQLKPWVVGPESVDASLGHLKDEAAAEVRDPQSKFGLRMTAESAGIRELRLTSPGGSQYVGIGMQTNYDDPLGKEWNGEDAIQTLLPGQTAEWKIRLEIFAVGNAGR